MRYNLKVMLKTKPTLIQPQRDPSGVPCRIFLFFLFKNKITSGCLTFLKIGLDSQTRKNLRVEIQTAFLQPAIAVTM